MSNYEYIYNNTIKNFIFNIFADYINKGEFPADITIDRNNNETSVKWGQLTIYTVYTKDLTEKELLIKMLNYVIYL